MGKQAIRILLVDDDEDDYFLTKELLAETTGNGYALDWVDGFDAGLAAICRGAHDVFLVDYRLGRHDGIELIRAAHAQACRGPIILLTGQGERDVDYAAMQAGAADYLEKSSLNAATLERAIRYALLQWRHEEELENKVRERTAALEVANAALEAEIRERQRFEQELRRVDRRKDAFLATLAHELRNPLAPMRNALEIMRLAGANQAAQERARAVLDRQMRHLIRLVDDLLDVFRISRGKVPLHLEPLQLSTAIEQAIEGAQPLLEAGQHQLSMALPTEPVQLLADPTRLAQVFLNLLNNAAKYTEPGGHVHLAAEIVGTEVVVTVRDNGIGIPTDVLGDVFEMFHQVSNARDRAQGGLGIGLSIVKSLVELHGGRVTAHSEGLGRGSAFHVHLPLLLAS